MGRDFRDFGSDLRVVMRMARRMARRLGRSAACPVHVLLSVLDHHSSRVSTARDLLLAQNAKLRDLIHADATTLNCAESRGQATSDGPYCRDVWRIVERARTECRHRRNYQVNENHLILSILECDRRLRRTCSLHGIDVRHVCRYLRIHTGAGLRPCEYILHPMPRRPCLEELSTELRAIPFLCFVFQQMCLLPDDAFLRNPLVQLVLARAPRDSDQATEFLIEELDRWATDIKEHSLQDDEILSLDWE